MTASADELSEQRVQILRRTTPLLEARREDFESYFFVRLFAGHPEIEALFDGMDLASHRAKLWTAISTMVASDGGHDQGYAPYIEYLGIRHVMTSVLPAYYGVFIDALCESIAHVLGTEWTDEVAAAWAGALADVASAMIDAGAWLNEDSSNARPAAGAA